MKLSCLSAAIFGFIAASCVGPGQQSNQLKQIAERVGPCPYMVSVESDPPGAVIEVDNDAVGKTPCSIQIIGDAERKKVAVPNFTTVVKAIPVAGGQFEQTKIIRFSDRIPEHMYFNMNLGPATPSVDVNINE